MSSWWVSTGDEHARRDASRLLCAQDIGSSPAPRARTPMRIGRRRSRRPVLSNSTSSSDADGLIICSRTSSSPVSMGPGAAPGATGERSDRSPARVPRAQEGSGWCDSHTADTGPASVCIGGSNVGIPRDEPRRVAERGPGTENKTHARRCDETTSFGVGDLLPAYACA